MAGIDAVVARDMTIDARVEDIEGFRLFRYVERHPFYRTSALPRASQQPAPVCVRALLDRCRALGIEPRAEFTLERWPGLAEALFSAGLTCEIDASLMVNATAAVRASSPITLRVLGPDAADQSLWSFLLGLGEALEPDEVACLRRMLKQNRVQIVLASGDEEVIAGGALIGSNADWRELGGLWTAPAYRGRGIATAVVGQLLAAAGSKPVWLAAWPQAVPLYRRLGFRTIGRRIGFGAVSSTSAPASVDRIALRS